MFTVIDDYIAGIPYLSSDPVDTQARDFGDMVTFWERMRNICSKVNTYNGPILREDGSQCRTSMRQCFLRGSFGLKSQSSKMNDGLMSCESMPRATWLEVLLPCKKDLLHTLLHTKDFAPGSDGLSFSAWRLLPEVTVDAMTSYFIDIMDI